MREFLMLAKQYEGQDIRGWYVSEKMDGFRAWWDGGVSRGMTNVPWAKSLGDVATGLWSRYAGVIHAPDWFLDQLPGYSLDGELWCGRGSFQQTMSACRKHVPVDAEWQKVMYHVFDSPSYDCVFQTGEINNPILSKMIRLEDCLPLINEHSHDLPTMQFKDAVSWMRQSRFWNQRVMMVPQDVLPDFTGGVQAYVEGRMAALLEQRGEGLVFRNPRSIWCPQRANCILKLKGSLDSEGEVIGYTWGDGKHQGRLGALIVKWEGKTFELSGFTDQERILSSTEPLDLGLVRKPGTPVPETVFAPAFPRGSTVTFTYRELTDAGYPKEARYLRLREPLT